MDFYMQQKQFPKFLGSAPFAVTKTAECLYGVTTPSTTHSERIYIYTNITYSAIPVRKLEPIYSPHVATRLPREDSHTGFTQHHMGILSWFDDHQVWSLLLQWMFHAWYVHPYTLVIIPIRPHPESERCSLVCLGRYWIPQNLEGLCTTDQHLLQQKPLPSRNPSKPYNWRFLAGKSSIHCGFSIAMFDSRRLFPECYDCCYVCWTSQGKCALQLVFALQCCNVVWINFRLNGGFCMCQKRILTGDRHDQCQGHFTRDVLPCQCDTTAPPFHPRKKKTLPLFHGVLVYLKRFCMF